MDNDLAANVLNKANDKIIPAECCSGSMSKRIAFQERFIYEQAKEMHRGQ